MDLSHIRQTYQGHKPTLLGLKSASAVLIPLVEVNDELSILYEVRSANIAQPGEVCFPGGRMEPNETPIQCALRETQEELGIPAEDIELIAELDFLHIRGDRLLYPVLGTIKEASLARLFLSPNEVADTFTVPLSWLRDHPPQVYRHRQKVEVPGFPLDAVHIDENYRWADHLLEVPIYHGLPYTLWGMTARMTMYLIETLYPA